MRILSNDYRSNLPRELDVAHGGPANFARAFSAHTATRGHEWIGLVQRGHDGDATRIRLAASAGRKTYYECSLPEARYRPYLTLAHASDPREWFAEELRAIRRFLRKVAPDALFLNGYSLYAWLLLDAASSEGLPIVIQHAGIARVEFEQYRHLYSAAGRAAMLRMEQDVVRLATTQVFLNDYSRDMFAALVAPVPKHQARVIPLPFAPEMGGISAPRGRRLRTTDAPVVIGCVARWDRIKNHSALLAMAKEARRRGLPWTFRSVTRIPDTAVQARLKAAYRKEIEVIAPMGRSALLDFYRSVDVLLLPSRFDVSPTVVMEAALLGKPTLISKGVGWVSEYRRYGMGAWIADMDDAPNAVTKLARLLRTPPSNRFRTMLRKRHAPAAVFNRYLDTFADAIRLCA